MRSKEIQLGVLACQTILPNVRVEAVIVLLHGYAMDTHDLAPLAAAMNLPAALYLPRGLLPVSPRGFSWWPIDEERRSAQLAQAPRDLFDEYPSRGPARAALKSAIEIIRQRHPAAPLFLAGFSQGGMLACDTLLHEDLQLAGLILMSTSRIAMREWQPHLGRICGLPVLVAHGRRDTDLALRAGENLRDCLSGAGARVTWLEFDGGHESPVTVWRHIKRMVRDSLVVTL